MVQSLQRSNPFRVAFDLPELLEIQRSGFNNFLKEGIANELSKISPIKIEKGDIRIELIVDGANFQLISPDENPRDCILKMKTYSCKLYVEATVMWKTVWGDILYQTKPEWVLLGHLPIMTKRGHFIINGSPRIIVHQVVRSPGIYFQEIIEARPKLKKSKKFQSLLYKNTKKRIRFYGDIIPRRGVWLRLQLTHKGRIEAKLKKGKKISARALQRCLEVIEKEEYLLSLTSAKRLHQGRTDTEYRLPKGLILEADLSGELSSHFRKEIPSDSTFPTIKNLFSLENKKNSLHPRKISSGDGTQSTEDRDFTFGQIFKLGKKWSCSKVNRNQLDLREGRLVQSTENFSNISTHVKNSNSSIDWRLKPFKGSNFYHGFREFAFGNPKQKSSKNREAVLTATVLSDLRRKRESSRTAIEYSLFSIASRLGLWSNNRVNPNIFQIDRYVSSWQTQYLSQEKDYQSARGSAPIGIRRGIGIGPVNSSSEVNWMTNNLDTGSLKKGDNLTPFSESDSFLHKKERDEECIAEEKAFSDTYDKLYRTAEDKEEEQWASKRKNRAFLKTVVADQTFKRKKCSKNLFETFKVGSRYDLSDLGREKINTKLGICVNVNQLTSSDITAASNWLTKLRKGEKSIDDIDHSQNRRIRTSGELLQTQFENGIDRLKKVTWNKLKELATLQSNSNYPLGKFESLPLANPVPKSAQSTDRFPEDSLPVANGMDVQRRSDENNNTPRSDGEMVLTSAEKPTQQNFQDLSDSLLPVNSSLSKETSFKEEDTKYQSSSYIEIGAEHRLVQSTERFAKIQARKACILALHQTRRDFFSKRSIDGSRYFTLDKNFRSKKKELRERRELAFSNRSDSPILLNALSIAPEKLRPGDTYSFYSTGRKNPYPYQGESDKNGINPYQGALYQGGIDIKDKGKYAVNQLNKEREEIKQFIKEKAISIKDLLNTKAINGALREFFGSNPLSQYMDQTNPLSEITHKRRISSLGVGGVSRESAGMAIRGIHPTHYGRICPIETPEGKNAGLVNSLAFYAKMDDKGFIKTPYYKVVKGQVQEELGFAFFSAKEEGASSLHIAPSDLQQSWNNVLKTSSVPVRVADNLLDLFKKINLYQVDCIGISPIQMISVATSLIPFLEHNDANRALMGSNMQRQAVPLMIPEKPLVGTGLESLVVAESGHLTQSKLTGFVSYVTAEKIVVEELASVFAADNLHQKYYGSSSSKEKKLSYEKVSRLSCQINLFEYLLGGTTLLLKNKDILLSLKKVRKWSVWKYRSPSSTFIRNSFKFKVRWRSAAKRLHTGPKGLYVSEALTYRPKGPGC